MVIYAASRGAIDLGIKTASTTQVKYPKLDITSQESIQTLVDSIKKVSNRVDVLINNAGLNLMDKDHKSSFESTKKIMEVNHRGTQQVGSPLGMTFEPISHRRT